MKKQILEQLKALELEELEELKKEIERLIREKAYNGDVFIFSFEATCDPRKGVPYVAKIAIDEKGNFIRKFYDLDKEYKGKTVTVWGKFKAHTGDIIEMRKSASWKNDWRSLHVVTPQGELKFLGYTERDSTAVMKVKKYLKGEITLEQLMT